MPSPFDIIALVVSAVAAVLDLRAQRIPNALTYSTIAFAFMAHLVWATLHQHNVLAALLPCVFSALLAAVVFLPLFYLGGMGGGDAKLAIGLAALIGDFDRTLQFFFFTFLCGAIWALGLAAYKGQLKTALQRLISRKARKQNAAMAIPYGPAFLFGMLMLLAWH